MKRLNLILLLSAVTVALAFVISCKETNAERLEKDVRRVGQHGRQAALHPLGRGRQVPCDGHAQEPQGRQ